MHSMCAPRVTRQMCCLWPLHDQPIDLAGVHSGNPGPSYAKVVVPRLVGKCTPVSPHPRFVVLTSFSACPGTPLQFTLSSTKKHGPNTRLLEIEQNTFIVELSLSISIRAWGFWDPHIRYCVCWHLRIKKTSLHHNKWPVRTNPDPFPSGSGNPHKTPAAWMDHQS